MAARARAQRGVEAIEISNPRRHMGSKTRHTGGPAGARGGGGGFTLLATLILTLLGVGEIKAQAEGRSASKKKKSRLYDDPDADYSSDEAACAPLAPSPHPPPTARTKMESPTRSTHLEVGIMGCRAGQNLAQSLRNRLVREACVGMWGGRTGYPNRGGFEGRRELGCLRADELIGLACAKCS
jgi:hypothetical protein